MALSILGGHGARGVDHIGLTVPDLDQAVAFFVDVLGATAALRHGPYPSSPDAPTQFGRPENSAAVGIAMVRLGGLNVELLEFHSPSASNRRPRPDEAGGHHLALYVDDLEGTVESLRAAGLHVFGAPMALPGPESGPDARFIFFRAPWGLVLELVSYSGGKSYQQGSPEILNDARTQPRLR